MLNGNTAYRFAIASVGVLLLLAACEDGPGTSQKNPPPPRGYKERGIGKSEKLEAAFRTQ